jgi:hypothetical protein
VAPVARMFYRRERVENLLPGGRKEGQIIVTEYSDEELLNIIKEQGEDPPELQRQADEAVRAQVPTAMEGDLPRGPGPAQIMGEASAQGITVPREQIGAFVSCVVGGLRSRSLPEAVGDCAKDLPGG